MEEQFRNCPPCWVNFMSKIVMKRRLFVTIILVQSLYWQMNGDLAKHSFVLTTTFSDSALTQAQSLKLLEKTGSKFISPLNPSKFVPFIHLKLLRSVCRFISSQ